MDIITQGPSQACCSLLTLQSEGQAQEERRQELDSGMSLKLKLCESLKQTLAGLKYSVWSKGSCMHLIARGVTELQSRKPSGLSDGLRLVEGLRIIT